MMMVTNIRHFLDENGEVPALPPEARNLLRFLSSVVVAASTAYGTPVALAEVECIGTEDGEVCGGEAEVWVDANDNRIGWECLECGNEGIISDWEGTRWDKRTYTCY